MKLSIVIPTFNSASSLCQALDSIVGQTFVDWEALVMDAASTDQTVEIAKSYHDDRIKVFSEPDKGIYDAMNKGIKKASGEWLYFLGSDDCLFDPNVLEKVFSQDLARFEVVYGDVNAPHLSEFHKGKWSLALIDYNRCHQAIFYRRRTIVKLGGYNLKYKVWADYDLNLKWFFALGDKTLYLPITIANFSAGGVSSHCEDKLLLADKPYLLLTRGRRVYGRKDKLLFINTVLQEEGEKTKRMFLKIWKLKIKAELKMSSLPKKNK